MIPTAALCRVSLKRQGEKDSIPTQRQLFKQYCKKNNFVLVAEYIEKGVSAYKLTSSERDILQDVFADAEAGKFRILLVFKSDRLSRQSFDYPSVLMRLHKAGVLVIAVADAPEGRKLNVEDQMDKLMRFMEGWQAESESKNTSIRVTHNMLKIASQGRWTGGRPPYGFQLSPYKNLSLEINPAEADILRLMANYYKEDLGSKLIAVKLNDDGKRTREGKLWRDSRVRDVLQNPIIAGLPAYNRTVPGNTPTSRKKIKDFYDLNNPNIIIPRDDEGNPKPIPEYGIISLEEWLELMQIIKANSNNTKRDSRTLNSPALLTGFIKCGYCGRGFISSKYKAKKTKNDKTYTYDRAIYRCITKSRIGTNYCEGQSTYTQSKIDSIFLNELKELFSSLNLGQLDQYVNTRNNLTLHRLKREIKQIQGDIQKTERRLSSWTDRLNQFFAEPESSLYSEDLLAEEVRKAEKDLKNLKKRLGEAKNEYDLAKREDESLKIFNRTAHNWYEIFQNASPSKRKLLLSQVVNQVIVWKDKMEITWKLNIDYFINNFSEQSTSKQNNVEIRVAVSL
ncbi:recombinase family protein [Desulfoscipio gibsoniae]